MEQHHGCPGSGALVGHGQEASAGSDHGRSSVRGLVTSGINAVDTPAPSPTGNSVVNPPDGVDRPRASAGTPRPPASWTVHTPTGSRRNSTDLRSTVELLLAWAEREVRTRYRQSMGRGLWNLAQPAFMVAIYGFVFTQVFEITGEGLPYVVMAWAGLVSWQFATYGIHMAVGSFLAEAGTLPKVWYPRIVVPLAPTVAALMDLAIGMVVLVALMIIQGVAIPGTIVLLPVPLILIVIWTVGLSLFVAPFTVFVRDLTAIVPLITRLGFFATPVMYAAATIPDDLQWMVTWNPFAVGIEGVRDVALRGFYPDWGPIAMWSLAGIVVVLLSYAYLRRVENQLVDAL